MYDVWKYARPRIHSVVRSVGVSPVEFQRYYTNGGSKVHVVPGRQRQHEALPTRVYVIHVVGVVVAVVSFSMTRIHDPPNQDWIFGTYNNRRPSFPFFLLSLSLSLSLYTLTSQPLQGLKLATRLRRR